MNIWLINPQKFYSRIIASLYSYGIHASYVCSESDLHLPHDCIRHSEWDAYIGRAPQGITPSPPNLTLIDSLISIEPLLFQMFDRLNYIRLPVQTLRRIYYRYVSMWSAIIAKSRPDVILFHATPHLAYDYVLYSIAKVLGIRTLIVERTYLPDRMILMTSLDDMPKPSGEDLMAVSPRKTDHSGPNYYDARNRYFQDHRRRQLTRRDLIRDSFRRILLFILQVARRPHEMLKPYRCSMYAISGRFPTRLTFLWRDMLDSIHLYRLRHLYESHTSPADLECTNYVYFPLQFQPERTSIPMGLQFADQLLALELLANSLPDGWLIYVKEHPRQFLDNAVRGVLGRNREFYEALFRLHPDRIRLIPTNTPSSTLIQHARYVATVGGTAGWEAVRSGVQALVFGATWYMHAPGVYRVNSDAECRYVLNQIHRGAIMDRALVESYTAWLHDKASFPGYMTSVFEKLSSLLPADNADSYALAITHAVNKS